MCTLLWAYHHKRLADAVSAGDDTPTAVIKVMDNCVGQNKSHVTLMFDCLLSILLYERVANLYLIPGHSHMKADQVVAHCKNALNRKNLFVPSEVVSTFNTVQKVDCTYVDGGDFYEWAPLLQKYFKN